MRDNKQAAVLGGGNGGSTRAGRRHAAPQHSGSSPISFALRVFAYNPHRIVFRGRVMVEKRLMKTSQQTDTWEDWRKPKSLFSNGGKWGKSSKTAQRFHEFFFSSSALFCKDLTNLQFHILSFCYFFPIFACVCVGLWIVLWNYVYVHFTLWSEAFPEKTHLELQVFGTSCNTTRSPRRWDEKSKQKTHNHRVQLHCQ